MVGNRDHGARLDIGQQHVAELVVLDACWANREFGLEQHEHIEEDETTPVVVVVSGVRLTEVVRLDVVEAVITGMMAEKSPSSTRLKLSGLMSSSA